MEQIRRIMRPTDVPDTGQWTNVFISRVESVVVLSVVFAVASDWTLSKCCTAFALILLKFSGVR